MSFCIIFSSKLNSDCINGTSEGCSNNAICFLNVCYPSGGRKFAEVWNDIAVK